VRTARSHLEQGGLFFFDGWFGPGVLTDPPVSRLKILQLGEGEQLMRFAEPGPLDVDRNIVEVNYRILRLRGNDVLETAEETHVMRFLFAPEVRYVLEKNGFELLHLCAFPQLDQTLSVHDWQMGAVGRAI
jgi:hypothetical protein